jgi:hypothetical protein
MNFVSSKNWVQMNEKTRQNEKQNLGKFGLVLNMRSRFENLEKK